jgi:uncharacterized protein (DUF2235 family)
MTGSIRASGPTTSKRLILCLDGTWMDSENGYEKQSLFSNGAL